ncbi:hypothetical protein LR48_Vigan10g113100 [Vigna angularis]|uniref:Uncharacterized protein n=1 Tax=Phaseolus angularis TaxID=3914 RepID=A0A0L9VKH9_PHAAN|nr:hypothetical protein LR48_Vigan10g113100 [Vigna angularis]
MALEIDTTDECDHSTQPFPTIPVMNGHPMRPSYRLALDEKALVDGLSKREWLDVAFKFNTRDTLLKLQASTMPEEHVEYAKKLSTVDNMNKNAIDYDHELQRKNNDLSLDCQKLKMVVEELTAQNVEITQQKGVLVTQLEEVHSEVFNEYQAEFDKTFRQITFFYKIPLDESNFNIFRDIYRGDLVNIQ